MLGGGIISSKLEAFCVKHLLPSPEKVRLFLDCRRIIVRNLALIIIIIIIVTYKQRSL